MGDATSDTTEPIPVFSDVPAAPRILDPDARFVRLARPSYDPDDRGVRTGAAPTLSVVGGVLVAASVFGAWLRVTRLGSDGGELSVVREVMGIEIAPGIAVLVLAILAVAGAGAWNRRSRKIRIAAHVVTLAAAVTAGAALLLLQRHIAAATQTAIQDAGFFDLNAGAGWGAWAALLGAAALLLASVFGLLRQPDPTPTVSTEDRS